MAYTERYVSTAGGGAHDGTTEADAWTFAEAIAAVPGAGVRVNVKGNHTTGSVAFTAGTSAAFAIWRGYLTTIGDLDDRRPNSDGSFNSTNVPVITVTGILTPAAWVVLQNLDLTASISSYVVGSTSVDMVAFIKCRVVNAANNAAAGAIQGDNGWRLIQSEFQCTGAAHDKVVNIDDAGIVDGCRVRSTAASACIAMRFGTVNDVTCYGASAAAGSIGVQFLAASSESNIHLVKNLTCYGINRAISYVNGLPAGIAVVINGHLTDLAEGINSLYSGTANAAIIEAHNRVRDITTQRTGLESLVLGEVTTDTGGASTDYTDAASGVFTLIAGAAGRSAGMASNRDAGAFQAQSGGVKTHAGMSGGLNG